MLEIIATTLEDAKIIEKCGADRIELVSALSEGGLTPSYGLVKAVLEAVSIPVNVMIRPHHQNFTYSSDEIKLMIEDVNIVKSLGANGVVLGVLDKTSKIDFHKLKMLLDVVGDLEVTFHRAIDECEDILEEVELLGDLPQVKRVLSSGGLGKAEDHLKLLRNMGKLLNDDGKILLVGSGINSGNMEKIMKDADANEIHVGTSVRKNNSCFESVDENKLKEMVDRYRKVKYEN